MSVNLEQYEKDVSKFNKDSEDIINDITRILENKDEAAAIQCLAIMLAFLIEGVKIKEQRDTALNNLIDNLKKLLDNK